MSNGAADWLSTELGAAIRRARLNAGFTQMQLSAAVSVEQTRLSRWELGKSTPGVLDLVELELALGLRRGDLFIAAGLIDLPPMDAERALQTDPNLDEDSRAVLLRFYRAALQMAAVTRRPRRRGGRTSESRPLRGFQADG